MSREKKRLGQGELGICLRGEQKGKGCRSNRRMKEPRGEKGDDDRRKGQFGAYKHRIKEEKNSGEKGGEMLQVGPNWHQKKGEKAMARRGEKKRRKLKPCFP